MEKFMIKNNNSTYAAQITVDPEIHFGKPCIAGTRIPVVKVLELFEAGASIREIIEEYYQDLTEEQVKACVRYAIDVIQIEEIHFAPVENV
jgi:uncharacterized protein (DUF433 family)